MRFPLVPLYARSLDISTVLMGFISSVYFLFAGLFSFTMDMLSDRHGRKPLAAAGLMGCFGWPARGLVARGSA